MKLYNTLSKKVEEIEKADSLNLYTCGPTVYNFAHIGNLRSYVMADLLYRTLKREGYNPRWVMNITDIDDKTIKGAIAEFGQRASVQDLKNHTAKYADAFIADLKAMNIGADEIEFVRVTDVMPRIQEFIVGLLNKGYAYKADDGSVYFSIEKYQSEFGDYGQLVGPRFLEGKKIGARVAVDEYEKDNLSDFALWKAWNPQSDGQIFWEYALLGKGRPGWHIECSAINHFAFGGKATDIHTGGVDLIFPHHTNEIAQSRPVYSPFVKYWHHCEHLQVDGKKMAKREQNIYTLADLAAKGFSGLDLRCFFLTAGFSSQQNFTWQALLAAKASREKLSALPETGSLAEPVLQALDNNLNGSEALAAVWSGGAKSSGLDQVLGLDLMSQPAKLYVNVGDDVKLSELVALRQAARDQKDFSKSDEIRKQIEDLGYEVLDTTEGQKLKRKITLN